jgi:hypothetical protein
MRFGKVGFLAPVLAAIATPAAAGAYTDDLTRCLVAKATTADHEALIRWMFAAFAAGPAVKELSQVTPEQRAGITAVAGKMFTRLITQDCRSESVAALKYEGSSAFEAGFSTLGKVAARDLMTDPAVQAEMRKLDSVIDPQQLEALQKQVDAPSKK